MIGKRLEGSVKDFKYKTNALVFHLSSDILDSPPTFSARAMTLFSNYTSMPCLAGFPSFALIFCFNYSSVFLINLSLIPKYLIVLIM
jgi:hypothetical protein